MIFETLGVPGRKSLSSLCWLGWSVTKVGVRNLESCQFVRVLSFKVWLQLLPLVLIHYQFSPLFIELSLWQCSQSTLNLCDQIIVKFLLFQYLLQMPEIKSLLAIRKDLFRSSGQCFSKVCQCHKVKGVWNSEYALNTFKCPTQGALLHLCSLLNFFSKRASQAAPVDRRYLWKRD